MRHGLRVASAGLLYFILISASLAQTTDTQSKSQDSLADAARKNRAKTAQVTTKRVWTSDDFASAGETESSVVPTVTSQESASEALRRFRLFGKEDLGTAVLKNANTPDVNFPERKNWEQRLFDAKQAWVEQVDRMVAHKDSNKDALDDEIRLAVGAQRTFEHISNEGIQQARAVNDPVLRAHLDYQRQLDSCQQFSGDLLQQCLNNASQRKLQMQREGTW